MMKAMLKSSVLIGLVSIYANVYAQNFIEGIVLYNRAQYDSLIQFVPDFVQANPNEEGLARYFLAESYYNKALSETNLAKVQSDFKRAKKEFANAVARPDLKDRFPGLYFFAKFKIGWCSYRLAESGDEFGKNLAQAYAEFLDFIPDAPDSIKIFSYYMAADSRRKENAHKLYRNLDQSLDPGALNEILKSYQTIGGLYDKILSFSASASTPDNLSELQLIVKLQKNRLNDYQAKFYSYLSPENFSTIQDQAKKENARQTALAYLRAANYDTLFSTRAIPERQFAAVVAYSKAMNDLYQYLLSKEERARNLFLKEWHGVSATEFAPEKLFRKANLNQGVADVESQEFNQLAVSFYDSVNSIAESDYWLGLIKMILNENDASREHFSNFIRNSASELNPSEREKYLLEDAQYRKYLLDFEAFYLAGDLLSLRKLAAEVAAFSPISEEKLRLKAQLNLFIKSILTDDPEQIWTEVLTGSDDEKLQQVLSTVRFILPRAAFNIGVLRQKYIVLLNRLLDITRIRRSDATRFFRGIVKTLQAEIEATPFDKSARFEEAAQILSSLRENFAYKTEADYIRAKCLFFADEFGQALPLFQTLVHDHRYLRALFYMAEIYRLNGEDAAARQCYETVIRKLEKSAANYDEFWLSNARAGMDFVENRGRADLAILDSLQIDQVAFQPELHTELLFYERLAEEKILKQKFARESVAWLIKYGMPQKEFYASKRRLAHSQFVAENIFDAPQALDEVRKPMTTALNLTVILPFGVDPKLEVSLDGDSLGNQDGVYKKRFVALNSVHELQVKNDGCYPYQNTVRFSKIDANEKVVILQKAITFHQIKGTKNLFKDFDYSLDMRWDANYVLNKLPPQSAGSQLKRDFATRHELRDCMWDRTGDRILVVNAEENSVWVYSAGPESERIGRLDLQLEDSLRSPEGIALDSHGQIYIADWGNHRVVITDNKGRGLQTIGRFGSNLQNVGQPVKLMFPTRVAIWEDSTGVAVDGEVHYREPILYIADRNGIHAVNLRGEYLGTPLRPANQIARGGFYAFTLSARFDNLKLFLAARQKEPKRLILEFEPDW